MSALDIVSFILIVVKQDRMYRQWMETELL
jgi:hypothetical protein